MLARWVLVIGIGLTSLLCSLSSPLMAVSFTDEKPWDLKPRGGPDLEAGGWYINLGITGARAKLTEKNLKSLVVTYVFKDTPAFDKLKKDDIIVGVNHRPFEVPHRNGYGVGKFGGEGPLMDFGNALEESQVAKAGTEKSPEKTNKGKKPGDKTGSDIPPGNGKLILDVVRNNENLKIVLDIGTKYGIYSESYPFNCKKTGLILSELYEYLSKNQSPNGHWGSAEADCYGALALLASGDKKYLPHVERSARSYAAGTSSKYTPGQDGLICWGYTFAGIVLSEYYLVTGEKWVLPELEEIRDWLMQTQYVEQSRQVRSDRDMTKNSAHMKAQLGGWGHNPGFEGYGPMCITTSQACMALSLMSRCGIRIDRERHEMALEFLDRGTGTNGYVGYSAGASKSTGDGWADMGRTGSTALANFLCGYGDVKYQKRVALITSLMGKHVESFPDTHASPPLGMGWQAAATALNPEGFKHLMEYHKWWLNLAHCPDGTFHYQPNRDNGRFYEGNTRMMMSAVVAFCLSVKNKNLHITGAASPNQDFQVPTMALSAQDVTAKTKSIYALLAGNNFSQAQTAITKLTTEMDARLENPLYKKDETEKELGLLRYFQGHIDGVMSSLRDQVSHLDSVGDVYKLQILLNESKKALGGIAAYDDMSAPHFALFKTPEGKKEIEAGKAFYSALDQIRAVKDDPGAQRSPKKAAEDISSPLKKFIEKNSGSNYSRVAQAIVDELSKYPLTVIQPKTFFKVKTSTEPKP